MRLWCGRALRCCLGFHRWITMHREDMGHDVHANLQTCDRPGCDANRIAYDFPPTTADAHR